MQLDTNIIFQIAGIGIVVAMIHTILKQMGKEDFAYLVTVVGFIIVFFLVMDHIANLFQQIKSVFLLKG